MNYISTTMPYCFLIPTISPILYNYIFIKQLIDPNSGPFRYWAAINN